MTALVPLVLLAWIAVAPVLFLRLPPRRAVIALFVLGVLFLPEVQFISPVPGMPAPLSVPGFKLTKVNAISYAALFASLALDFRRWESFRPRWFDVPMALWCVCPLFSSLANELGVYDGVAQALDLTWTWGVPYLLGRLYLGTPEGFRELAVVVVLGALVYVPFCLYEMRMSPQLHRFVYGYAQHEFLQTLRYGGYRPMVFMPHGLAVSLWMVAATLLAFWLWWTGAVPGLTTGLVRRPIPMLGVALVLLATCVLCKSTGALVLGAAGGGVLVLMRRAWLPAAAAALLAVAPLYIGARATGTWTGQDLVEWVKDNLDEGRAQSLEFRFTNENLLAEKALERPVFGWGGWARSHVYDEDGKDITVADGVWIIALADRGLFGMTALYLALLLPPARFLLFSSRDLLSARALAPAAVGAVLLALFTIDSLLNAGTNPVFMLMAGGLAGLAGSPPGAALQARRAARARRAGGFTESGRRPAVAPGLAGPPAAWGGSQ
jgi:hypothetical protein